MRRGEVRWGEAGRDVGNSVRQKATVPLALQGIEDYCPEPLLGSTMKFNPRRIATALRV